MISRKDIIMKDKKIYMEKIYEQFSDDIKPTEEMKKLYDEFSEKILELKGKLNEKQVIELTELEDLFSEIMSLEVKQSFYKGFSVAINLNSEVM